MRIIKPHVVKHGKNAVYSMDFQPVSAEQSIRRLATCGGDSMVKLWDVASLMDEAGSEETSLLATLEHHSKAVNACRWSVDGSYLGSAGDDMLIILYTYTPTATVAKPFGSKAVLSKESWSRTYTLHGHRMEVLDIAWSVTNLLASASLDNTVRVWSVPRAGSTSSSYAGNSGDILSAIRVLDGHCSFVKGVSFDPIGRHLASSGADNKLLVWNTSTWQVTQSLLEPFEDSVDVSIFRRTDWAPDGGALCLSSAVKKSKPVGMIISRSSWSQTADLVGHDAPTTCCRFYGRVMESHKSGPVSSTLSPSCIVALGDQEGLLSVWTTSRMMPVIVARDVFSDAIVDVAWTSVWTAATAAGGSKCDGTSLVLGACSLDGTICLLVFDPLDNTENEVAQSYDPSAGLSSWNVFGREMSAVALDRHFVTLYSQKRDDLISSSEHSVNINPQQHVMAAGGGKTGMVGRNAGVPLTIASMQYASKASVPIIPPVLAGMVPRVATTAAYANPMVAPGSPPPLSVVSVRPKDGKKRIAPVSVGSSIAGGAPPVAGVVVPSPVPPNVSMGIGSINPSSASSTSMETSSPKRARLDVPQQIQPPATMMVAPSQAFPAAQPQSSVPVTAPARARQVVSQALPPGQMDPIAGGVLQYVSSADAVVSSYFLQPAVAADGTWNNDCSFIIRVPPSAELGSMGSSGNTGSRSLLSHRHSSPQELAISVQVIARPKSVTNAFGSQLDVVNRSGLAAMSLVTLKRGGSSSPRNLEPDGSTWSVWVPGRASVGCVLRLPQPTAPSSNPFKNKLSSFMDPTSRYGGNRDEGIVFIGASDGSLHISSLASGLRVYPTLLLGAPVVNTNCFTLISPAESEDVDAVAVKDYHCMAACADGEVLVWRIETAVYKPSSGSDSRTAHGSRLSTAFIAKKGRAFSGLSLLFKANVRPIIQSIRSSNSNPSLMIKVDKVFLSSSDLLNSPHSFRVDAGTGELTLVAVVHAPGAEGGDWQVFRFMSAAGCWSRVSDLRFILSVNGTPPSVSSFDSVVDSSRISCGDDFSLETLPMHQSTIKTQDVAIAARLIQQEKMQQQLGRLPDSQGSITDRVAAHGYISPFDWGDMVSLCHAEEKLSGFFYELWVQEKLGCSSSAPVADQVTKTLKLGPMLDAKDLAYWLQGWIRASIKMGMVHNIKWLGERLLILLSKQRPAPRLSEVSPHGSVRSTGSMDITTPVSGTAGGGSNLNTPVNNAGGSSNGVGIQWYLSSAQDVSDMLQETVLPAIGQAGRPTDLHIQSLLQQIDDACALLNRAVSLP